MFQYSLAYVLAVSLIKLEKHLAIASACISRVTLRQPYFGKSLSAFEHHWKHHHWLHYTWEALVLTLA